jgi:hypothetical protein
MSIQKLKVGMKVLIIKDDLRGNGKYLSKTATITDAYHESRDEWILDIDTGMQWWPGEYLKVLCCGAKGCMWHKKDSK